MLPTAASKNITMDFAHEGDSSAYQITGDADRLQQVVWNLLSNAVKFTPQDGRVQIGLSRELSSVKIVVSDTGMRLRIKGVHVLRVQKPGRVGALYFSSSSSSSSSFGS